MGWLGGRATTLPLIDGRFRLLRLLAAGGMGELYLAIAQDPEIEGLEQLVVMKRILPEFASDRAVVTMFMIEARIAARLDHPNVVRVYDMGRAGGSLYFTMEYLHGADLGRLFDASRTRGGFPLGHAITILIGVCAGLHFAHEVCRVDGRPLGVVHRDVSPGNVFVTFEGEIKVVDFGVARVLTPKRMTQDGTRKGKLAYMSPEQVRGEAVDRRSDIYAIGILLYELVTMSHLFEGDNDYVLMEQITSGQVPRPSTRRKGVPAELERIIMKALSLRREDRHEHAIALAEDLVGFAQTHGVRVSTLALKPFLKRMIGQVEFPWYLDEEGPEEAPAVAQWFASAAEDVDEDVVEAEVDISLDDLFDFDEAPEEAPVAREERAVVPMPRPERPRRSAGAAVAAAAAGLGAASLLLLWRCSSGEEGERMMPRTAPGPMERVPAEVQTLRPVVPVGGPPAAEVEAVAAVAAVEQPVKVKKKVKRRAKTTKKKSVKRRGR